MSEPTPFYSELKHFVDVSSRQTINSQPEKITPKNPEDTKQSLLKAAEEYWTLQGKSPLYAKGMLIGSGDPKNLFNDFLKNLVKIFEEVIRHELQKKDITFEQYSPDLKTLHFLLNMISNHIFANGLEVSKDFVPVLNGFINSIVKKV